LAFNFRNIVELDQIDTPNTQIHDCSLSWLGTGTYWLRCSPGYVWGLKFYTHVKNTCMRGFGDH